MSIGVESVDNLHFDAQPCIFHHLTASAVFGDHAQKRIEMHFRRHKLSQNQPALRAGHNAEWDYYIGWSAIHWEEIRSCPLGKISNGGNPKFSQFQFVGGYAKGIHKHAGKPGRRSRKVLNLALILRKRLVEQPLLLGFRHGSPGAGAQPASLFPRPPQNHEAGLPKISISM